MFELVAYCSCWRSLLSSRFAYQLSMIGICVACVAPSANGDWSVTPRNTIALNTSEVSSVQEMSGVTYLGPAGGGLERFIAVQDSGSQFVAMDVGFTANGSISSATGVSTTTLSPGLDFEGVAFTNPNRNSIFVSEESTPAVREYDLTSGNQLQVINPPAVYSNIRSNRGFESLARSVGGTIMWTANEEALTIDGPSATNSNGTVVRLQKMFEYGNDVTSGAQFAYEVDPVHAGNPNRSGLADLTLLPDGTLLALERSAATAFPAYESRIYQIDFSEATNVGVAQYDGGLIGTSFTPVQKTLLWSGQVGGGFGQNLEGLTLGSATSAGWALIGVVDDGDSLSGNTVASFEITTTGCSLAGDYNCSGTVDAFDYETWRDTFGSTELLFADGNANGEVDAADYTIWLQNQGASSLTSVHSLSLGDSVEVIPEPASCTLLMCVSALAISRMAHRRPR